MSVPMCVHARAHTRACPRACRRLQVDFAGAIPHFYSLRQSLSAKLKLVWLGWMLNELQGPASLHPQY